MNRRITLTVYLLTCCVLAAFITGTGCISSSPAPAAEHSEITVTPTPSPEVQEQVPTLTGITWELVSYDSGRIAQESVTVGTTVTARFERGGIVHGSSGCNQYSASFESTGTSLLISTPQHTRERCHAPAGVETQEKVYLLDLERVRTWSIGGGLLRLMDENGRVTLLFREREVPSDAPRISQETWYLSTYRNDTGAMTPPPGGIVMTAGFLDGTLSGFSGCNCYRATYQEDGGVITIGEPVRSDTWCRNEAVTETEGAFFDNLKDAGAYIVDSDSLQMVDIKGEPLLVFHSDSP